MNVDVSRCSHEDPTQLALRVLRYMHRSMSGTLLAMMRMGGMRDTMSLTGQRRRQRNVSRLRLCWIFEPYVLR
jgi:hypothetical protein